MIETINLSKKELEDIKKSRFSKGAESSTYIYNENGVKKIIKIFNNDILIDNKISKINLMSDRLKKCNFVVTAESIVKSEGVTVGYIMPKIEGNNFTVLDYDKQKNINILKEVSLKLKQLHKLGIVCADFHSNFLIGKDGNIYFIDYDNFAIDELPVDTQNIYLRTYKKSIKKFDKNFDNYLMNIFTLAVITRTYTPYIYDQYKSKPQNFYFRDKEINKIIENTFNLKKFYNEDLIINQINSKQDLKKIKRKIF